MKICEGCHYEGKKEECLEYRFKSDLQEDQDCFTPDGHYYHDPLGGTKMLGSAFLFLGLVIITIIIYIIL